MKKLTQLTILFVFAYSLSAQTPIEYINAKDYGAKANDEIDDSQAIQKALDAAGKNGGVCLLPAGEYRLNEELVVPEGVTLKGIGETTPHALTPVTTVLNIYAGKGDVNAAPAITLKWNASVKNMIINYPEQQLPDVIPYPWTIQIDGQMCQVIDVTMTNPYMAIDAGSNSNELHIIRNVYACPLKIGVYVDQTYDVGRLENVHFNPNFWKRSTLKSNLPEIPEGSSREGYMNSILLTYLQENLVGFKIGKTDWEYITNCFVIFAKEGFLFDDFGHGPGNALITQSGSDIGPVGVQVNKVQRHAGIQFTNCQFMSTIKIGPENEGPVKISNSGFWIIEETLEQVVNEGPGTVILNACHFSDWDIPNEGAACIRASNGRLIVSNCEFSRPWTGNIYAKKTAVLLEKDFISGIITANLFHNDSIENKSTGNLALSSNIFEDYSEKIAIANIQLKDFCLEYKLNLANVIALLNKNGIQAKAESTIREISQKSSISPQDLYKLITTNHRTLQ